MQYDRALSSLKAGESTTVYTVQNGRVQTGTVTKTIGFENGIRKNLRRKDYYLIEMYGGWQTAHTATEARDIIDNPWKYDWLVPLDQPAGPPKQPVFE